MNHSLLEISHLSASYGEYPVLNDVSLSINDGEIIALMGPNGCGKTTVLKSLYGITNVTGGEINFRGSKLLRVPHQMIKHGIAYVPQGRRTFANLTVRENLELGGYFINEAEEIEKRIDEVLVFFPALKAKLSEKAGSLSGGQQQMLAIARGLMTNPELLLLDEPTLGLSPKIVSEMFDIIKRINREQGTAIIVVEHNIKSLLPITNRVYVLDKGEVVYHGSSLEFQKTDLFERVFLGK